MATKGTKVQVQVQDVHIDKTMSQIYCDVNNYIKNNPQLNIVDFEKVPTTCDYVISCFKLSSDNNFKYPIMRNEDLLIGLFALNPIKCQITYGQTYVDIFELTKNQFRYAVNNNCMFPLISMISSTQPEIFLEMIDGSHTDIECIYAKIDRQCRAVLAGNVPIYLDIQCDKKIVFADGKICDKKSHNVDIDVGHIRFPLLTDYFNN